jgi:hypothetical protein
LRTALNELLALKAKLEEANLQLLFAQNNLNDNLNNENMLQAIKDSLKTYLEVIIARTMDRINDTVNANIFQNNMEMFNANRLNENNTNNMNEKLANDAKQQFENMLDKLKEDIRLQEELNERIRLDELMLSKTNDNITAGKLDEGTALAFKLNDTTNLLTEVYTQLFNAENLRDELQDKIDNLNNKIELITKDELNGEKLRDDLTKDLPRALQALSDLGLRIQSVQTKEGSLEEVFLHLTGRRLRD